MTDKYRPCEGGRYAPDAPVRDELYETMLPRSILHIDAPEFFVTTGKSCHGYWDTDKQLFIEEVLDEQGHVIERYENGIRVYPSV